MTAPSAIRPIPSKTPPAAALLPLLLIFICGVAVGALAMSLIHHSGSKTLHSQNEEVVRKWGQELNLTDAQKRDLIVTLDDLNKYYYNVIADGKDRILAILDDGQKRKFDQILREKRKL